MRFSWADSVTFLCSVFPVAFLLLSICSVVQEVYSEIETLAKKKKSGRGGGEVKMNFLCVSVRQEWRVWLICHPSFTFLFVTDGEC